MTVSCGYRGFRVLIAECTHSGSKRCFEKLDFREFAAREIQTFLYEGEAFFKDVPSEVTTHVRIMASLLSVEDADLLKGRARQRVRTDESGGREETDEAE